MKKITLGIALALSVMTANRASGAWTDTITLKGDLRLRNDHTVDETSGTKVERTRQRLRVRAGLGAHITDNLAANVRLASGESATEVTSTNQNLDGYGSKKLILLDLAYFDWRALDNLTVLGGKMPIPFYQAGKSDLIFDSDLTPEGMALKYAHKIDAVDVWANAGQAWLDETSANAKDVILYGGQLGVTLKQEGWNATVGASSYNFSQIKGSTAFVAGGNGNTVTTVGTGTAAVSTYDLDYKLTNYFVEVGFNVGDVPVVIYADMVSNSEATDNKEGSLFGVRAGKAKETGDWMLDITSRELKKDATLGLWTDSDSWGGGTDGKGIRASLGYTPSPNTLIALTQFSNEKTLSAAKAYSRTMLDFSASF